MEYAHCVVLPVFTDILFRQAELLEYAMVCGIMHVGK